MTPETIKLIHSIGVPFAWCLIVCFLVWQVWSLSPPRD